jgi:hypothetical protein
VEAIPGGRGFAYHRRVGFGREAGRVRDLSLPARYRLHALGSCIQLVRPIGFNATWSYLQAKVQRPWRDPEFAVPAIGLLEAERAVHLSIAAEFARLRREQKAAGLRFPPRGHVTPTDPRRWHGDERLGAFHALGSWRGLRGDQAIAEHPTGRSVLAAVNGILEMGPGHAAALDLDELQRILDWARRQIYVIGWDGDRAEHYVAWCAYRLLGQLHLAANGATPDATPWNFRA